MNPDRRPCPDCRAAVLVLGGQLIAHGRPRLNRDLASDEMPNERCPGSGTPAGRR